MTLYRELFAAIVPGAPVAKGRPRFTRSGHAYTPERTRRWEEEAAAVFRASGRSTGVDAPEPIDEALWADLRCMWGLPKRGRVVGQPRTSRPDLDNLIKAVGDALILGGIIRDDSLIWKWTAVSVYAEEPGVSIALYAPAVQSCGP